MAVIMLIIEFQTVVLISIWFVGGALAAMVAALCGAPTWLQIVIFAGISLLLMLLARPILKKHFLTGRIRTNVDAMIGKKGIVIEPIDNIAGTGRVRVGGMDWAARSMSGKRIETDAIVKVNSVTGVKIIVEPIQMAE